MVQIMGVIPKQNYCLEVQFDNEHAAILNLKSKLNTVRFTCLKDQNLFETVQTKGDLIYWGNKLELSVSEVLQLIEKRE